MTGAKGEAPHTDLWDAHEARVAALKSLEDASADEKVLAAKREELNRASHILAHRTTRSQIEICPIEPH